MDFLLDGIIGGKKMVYNESEFHNLKKEVETLLALNICSIIEPCLMCSEIAESQVVGLLDHPEETKKFLKQLKKMLKLNKAADADCTDACHEKWDR
jgi:hypothetical protein